MKPNIYVIGSLRNKRVPQVAYALRTALDCDVFDDWYAAGPEADDHWAAYERGKGHTFEQALEGFAAQNVFRFDLYHLAIASHVVLVLPAGKSGHLELGWALGQKKKGYILLESEDPERFDIMYNFATKVVGSVEALVEAISA